MKTLEQLFGNNKITPIVTCDDIDGANRVCDALLAGGLDRVTFNMSTQSSLKMLDRIVTQRDDIIIGVGNIMDAAGFMTASLAGVKYIGSLGITDELMTAAKTRYNDADFLPGVLLPSQIMEVMSAGFNVACLYPAAEFNGANLLDRYAIDFPHMRFVAKGGINFDNMGEYLLKHNVICVSISDIVEKELIDNGDFAEITVRARRYMEKMQSILSKAE